MKACRSQVNPRQIAILAFLSAEGQSKTSRVTEAVGVYNNRALFKNDIDWLREKEWITMQDLGGRAGAIYEITLGGREFLASIK